jgi:glycosyltransferase involved in cell wall biosynthesis
VISVVILTQDEAANIERCLASVSWADDILVVDSGSTDLTRELAGRLGARVLVRRFDNFAAQRNFALDEGRLAHDWVLHLDADETVTLELRREIEDVARNGSSTPAFRVPFRLMLMGRWLKHSGMYPGYQVRFGRRDRLRFTMVGHGQREALAPDEVGTLEGDLIHDNFSKGISDWTAKHSRYARDEAQAILSGREGGGLRELLRAGDGVERRRALKALSRSLPMRPAARFLYVYFLRRGFLDGRAGYRYARLMAWYQWLIDMNLAESRARRTDDRR